MSLEKDLQVRSGNKCELCQSTENLSALIVEPATHGGLDENLFTCTTCKNQYLATETIDANHWRCLNDSMWSEHSAVKVIAWRMLNRLKNEGWPKDLLDMMYLEPETAKWAAATGEGLDDEEKVIHKDSNGVQLEAGDNVVLIKDLVVKGGNFTAKRGTAVRNITLDRDNAQYIEGKVNGQHIVIITDYVKK